MRMPFPVDPSLPRMLMTMLVPVVGGVSRHDDSTNAEVGDGLRNDVERVFADLRIGEDAMTGHHRSKLVSSDGSKDMKELRRRRWLNVASSGTGRQECGGRMRLRFEAIQD